MCNNKLATNIIPNNTIYEILKYVYIPLVTKYEPINEVAITTPNL